MKTLILLCAILTLHAPNAVQENKASIEPKKIEKHICSTEDKHVDAPDPDVQLLAQLVQAEAGNQDIKGMQYVADVVINRTKDSRFPDTIEGVIYQNGQFSCIYDGNFSKAAYHISEDAYKAAEMELNTDKRLDDAILYFSGGSYAMNGKGGWKYGAHWFSY